jgi:LysR family transcriptional regulator, hydrogen peroxide-inducible genes activator
MTLTELRYIVAVADERHFGRAAEKSFVSQPSLSASIRKVEEELGVTLFERGKAGVLVTEIGAQVVAQARRTLEEAARVKTVAKQGRNPLAGVLRLGVIHTIAPYLLPGLVAALRTAAPHMPLDIEENMTANLDRMLREGEIDVAILALPFQAPGVETLAVYDEEFRVVVPAKHALARKKHVPVDALDTDELLLLPAGHCLRDQVLGSCTEFSRAPPAGRQGNSLETLRSMVASGLGITVLPATALTDRHASALVKSVPFEGSPPQRRVALAWRKGFARMAAVRRIAEAIRGLDLPVSWVKAEEAERSAG